eukprot:c22274_g1_i1 orf=74-1207(+)
MVSRGSSSFTRKGGTPTGPGALPSPFIRPGPHATSLVSSGFADLDKIIGGGFPVGSLVMVMEDPDSPHHLLLMRYFMAQGLVHGQPLLFGSPLSSPESFLGTLPGLSKPKEGPGDSSLLKSSEGEGLRIAWQYRKFVDEQQSLEDRRLQQQKLLYQSHGVKQEYCSTFDVKKQVERTLLTSGHVECINLQSGTTVAQLQENCRGFCTKLSRPEQQIGRIALQSLCAPQGLYFNKDWELLGFLHSLKGLLRASNAVALITFPASLLTPSFSVRWQHMADILLSIESIADDDKDMAAMLTDYHEIIGFVRILKLACINTQMPTVPESSVYALKFVRRRTLSLERLNQAPVDASGGESSNKSASSLLCSGPAKATSPLDF